MEEVKQANYKDFNWQTFRSELYLRHRGICWVCHEFIELQDYEVGHLVDRCNGGQDAIENLAPMHKWCNNSKPRHNTLEEHTTWLLKTRCLDEKSSSLFPNTASTSKGHTHRRLRIKPPIPKPQLPVKDLDTNKTIFQSSPNLQNTSDTVKLEVIKLLGHMLDIPTQPTKAKPVLQTTRLTNYNIPSRYYHKRMNLPPRISPPKPLTPEQLDKIKPQTICWIQGRPMGGAMWKVLPPPYRQEDLFTTRVTPPGANDNGLGSIKDTLQVIGGILTQEVNLTMGHVNIHIHPNGTNKPSITFSSNSMSNNTTSRSQTVGMGVGQIPIQVWKQAKAQGITFAEFKTIYYNKANSPQPI